MIPSLLQSVTIRGFRSILAIEGLDLRPINVLIGPNGSGKSNFLAAFDFLRAVRDGRLREYVTAAGGAERILRFGSKVTPQMDFHLAFRDGANRYQLRLAVTDDDGLYPLEERVRSSTTGEFIASYPSWRSLEPLESGREAGISSDMVPTFARQVRSDLGTWRRYHFHDTSASSPMRKRCRIDDNRFLRADGANLAAFLYLLSQTHQDSFTLVQDAIRRVAPFFQEFRLEPLQLDPSSIQLEWTHRASEAFFDASSLSDGSLRFVALATLLLQPAHLRPGLVLVDEPELGLHPSAIELLAAMIRRASKQTQVIVATQSSLLLDHFEPEDILVADRVQGGTRLSRLQAEPLSEWLADYSLGQLWEKNEIGGRPATE